MAKKTRGKRPCCICRKWFQPDVRQKERQVTCGNPNCMKERHRRQCKKWNNSNKEYFKNNYLSKKIEQVKESDTPEAEHIQSGSDSRSSEQISLPHNTPFCLPSEVIVEEYGMKNLVLIHYLAIQIIAQTRDRITAHHKK